MQFKNPNNVGRKRLELYGKLHKKNTHNKCERGLMRVKHKKVIFLQLFNPSTKKAITFSLQKDKWGSSAH